MISFKLTGADFSKEKEDNLLEKEVLFKVIFKETRVGTRKIEVVSKTPYPLNPGFFSHLEVDLVLHWICEMYHFTIEALYFTMINIPERQK